MPEERTERVAKVQKGKATVKIVHKAHGLLASDETVERQNESDVAATYRLSMRSVERIRKDFCERGMAVLSPKSCQPRSDKKFTGELEAHLIAIACSKPPAGESRWKVQAIADRLGERQVVETLSHTSMETGLKKRAAGRPR